MADIPPPPPGFELVGNRPQSIPPPPPGFELVGDDGDQAAAMRAKATAQVAAERARAKEIDEINAAAPYYGSETGPVSVVGMPDSARNYARGHILGSYLDEALAGTSALANK